MCFISEFLPDVLVNTVIDGCCGHRLLDANTLVDLGDDLWVQVRSHDDVFLLHFLEVLVGFLVVALLVVVLDHLGEHITKTNGLLDAWGVHKLVANLHGSGGIVGGRSKGLTSLNELFDDANSLAHHG